MFKHEILSNYIKALENELKALELKQAKEMLKTLEKGKK